MTAKSKVGTKWAYLALPLAWVASTGVASAGDDSVTLVAVPPIGAVRVLDAGPTETITMTQGTAYEALRLARPFARVKIGDPRVVDIPESKAGSLRADNEADLVPISAGATNVIFFDKDNKVIKNVGIIVDDGGLPGRIKIHNKAMLNSFTLYRCSSTNCEYTKEVTVQEPAPLPKGNLNQNQNVITQSLSGEGGQQPPAGVTFPSGGRL
jgi:Flp pilus assembly secretin CpaC